MIKCPPKWSQRFTLSVLAIALLSIKLVIINFTAIMDKWSESWDKGNALLVATKPLPSGLVVEHEINIASELIKNLAFVAGLQGEGLQQLSVEGVVNRIVNAQRSKLKEVRQLYEAKMLKEESPFFFKRWYEHHPLKKLSDFKNHPDHKNHPLIKAMAPSLKIQLVDSRGRALRNVYQKSAHVHEDMKLVFLTIPKVGSTVFRAFNLHAAGKVGNPAHMDGLKGESLLSSDTFLRSPSKAYEIYTTPGFLKFATVRNPMVRVLSAYLSKRGSFNFDPYFHSNFAQFIEALTTWKPGSKGYLDVHYLPMVEFGHLPQNARYDVIAKFEEQSEWAPPLLQYIEQVNHHKNASAITPSLLLGREEALARFRKDFEKVLQHYDSRTFGRVRSFYKADIEAFGYESEVRAMELSLAFKEHWGSGEELSSAF